MVWKSGKSGIHTGRTVRSRFAHKTRSRREGLLIHSSSDENHEKTELVTYSLGKQNRWLLPEVIKANSVEIENEVVLIERFSSEGSKNNGRADCFSVYSPKSSTTHRPKRRFSHAKNLLRHGEHMKSRYEVAYPYPAGSWPAGRELSRQKVGTHLGHRKKNANVRFMLEEESDGNTEEIENLNSDSEHDFPDQWGFYKVSGRPSTFDLIDWMTAHGTRKLPESRNINTPTESRKRVENCEEQGLDKGKCIYVGTDDEMYDIHLELLVEIKETSRALIATEQDNGHPVRNKVRRRARRWRWRRKRWSRRFQNRGSGDNCEGPSSMQIGVFEPVVEDHTKSFSIALRNQDIRRETLEQRWGKLYREGCSLPRIFALDVTPLISHHSNATEESLVLFRLVENQPGFSSNQVKAFVSIVMCHDRTISETMWPKLVSQMKANTVEQEMWSLEDVMDIMLACFCSNDAGLRNGKVDYSEPRKPKQSLSILNEVLGWNSKTFSAKGARKDVKKLLEKGMSNQLDSSSCSSVDLQFEQHMDCGICFEDLQVVDLGGLPNYTALRDCGHMFCNKCWKAHLETQIRNGQVLLSCPGHGCRTLIDDVTLVFLVPSWYSRHLERKLDSLMETSPDWKWCPADRCKLIAKTTALQCTSRVQEVPGTMIQSVPVICSCGNMWCFKCQEDAHWPATCNEAHVFRQKNEGYAKMLSTDRTRLITSVDVKNCPFCHYPIEKDQGCEHMVCSMCYKEFCWLCLQEWAYPHFCKTSPFIKQRHVELPIYTKHFRTYEHIAATSRISRSPSVILNIHRKLDKLGQGLKNFERFSSLRKDCSHNGCVPRLLNNLSNTNAVHHLREVFNFKFQALLALEGAAITLSLSKETSNKFALEFDRLLFIVERLDEILQNFSESCQMRSLQKLAHFVMCGKKCILTLGRSKEIHK